MAKKSDDDVQSYNWLIIGRQRTGKTAALLAMIIELQYAAFKRGKKKRVLIFNPDGKNDVFEKKSLIINEVRNTIPEFAKMPGSLKKISASNISKIGNANDDLYNWYVVTDGDIKDFSDPCRVLRDFIIVYDDCNNIITGNIAGKRFEGFKDVLAGNRIRNNDTIITYHDTTQVPPKLWTYFQRAIVKQTDDADSKNPYANIGKAKKTMIQALQEVEKENQRVKNPDGDFAQRVVWLNEEYVFQNVGNELVTKIGNKMYKAVGKKIEPIV